MPHDISSLFEKCSLLLVGIIAAVAHLLKPPAGVICRFAKVHLEQSNNYDHHPVSSHKPCEWLSSKTACQQWK